LYWNDRRASNARLRIQAHFCVLYSVRPFAVSRLSSSRRHVPLSATNLGFGYPHLGPRQMALAVADVSIRLAEGALVGILGPNGSGKTTLLKLLAGLLAPGTGHVELDGRDLARMPARLRARRIAVVPQETQLAFDYSVLELALMGRYPHLGPFEVEGPADLAAARAGLAATGTAHLEARMFQQLSGGEKQRVVIASALAQLDDGEGARLLFLDEPTASLDLKYQLEVAALLRRLHQSAGATIVLSTHDLRFAAAVCTEIVLLSAGRVLAQGPPAAVLTPAAIATLYGIELTAVPAVL
jgi:iron complex transport system ATP-binding protein